MCIFKNTDFYLPRKTHDWYKNRIKKKKLKVGKMFAIFKNYNFDNFINLTSDENEISVIYT